MKFYNIIFILTALLGLSSCNSSSEEKTEIQNEYITVTAHIIGANDDSGYLTASGKVIATNSASLSTRMMGFVDKMYVQMGDTVRKDQLLLKLNNADLTAKQAQTNAGIAEAAASFKNAEKDYQRFQNLFAENSASQKELDDQRARFEMSKARLELARQMKNEVNSQFAYVNLRAPFNGVITNTFIDTGDMASPGVPLVSIESLGSYSVIVSVPENEIAAVTSGGKVQVLIKSINTKLTGIVTEISSSAKNTGGQYLVKVSLDKPDAKMLSGMYATVQFPIEKNTSVATILIPQEAIVYRGQLTGIYTMSQSDKALLRWVRLGRTLGDSVEVLSGIEVGEKYILAPEGKLYNGANITIKE